MATNKNAQLRYKILDECFSNRYKKFFIEDLIHICSERISEHLGKEVSVSRRQLLDDIKFMESSDGYEAPIEHIREGRKVFYRYENPNFSIRNRPFNQEESESLSGAMEILSRIGLNWLEPLQLKLQSIISFKQEKIIDFEENKFLKGLDFLNPLYHYIINKQSLLIHYKPFVEDEKEFLISPYYLKQYNNRWFLLGQNHTENYLQVIALDRIINLEQTKEHYIEHSIDFDEYFDEIVGVTHIKGNEIEQVKIELSKNIIPYVMSKPLHGSQKIKGNILTFEVRLNYELENLILSYGESMKVLAPETLKNRILHRLESSLNQYSE
ncbi:helix-turn-helix transcriptional regulator [Bergeyella zoohelcum]|uniref:WYL domain-containing protein n=1 Tax=Bergeyella zoohelcum TaxID=1015 RepID=A0A7Z8YQJ7_9FLAO|nr:WYL domain-containing protein [Bergeyella zoohelcum]VDH03628.1 Uncharacterised protein [Bergeyella zoohelcum]